MKFSSTGLEGAFLIEIEPHEDERGFFARTCCKNEFSANGLRDDFVQCSISFNKKKGTLRGMHFQAKPFEENKLVRCTMGAIYDVIVDLRPGSPTFKKWFAVELTAANRKSIYIPTGFAHGFQTLEEDSEVLYQITEFYHPECARGVRWDDAALKIEWPEDVRTISSRDASYPYFGS